MNALRGFVSACLLGEEVLVDSLFSKKEAPDASPKAPKGTAPFKFGLLAAINQLTNPVELFTVRRLEYAFPSPLFFQTLN
mmetsp:Transcript_45816/g.103494  ORF Transcript_45816/g.103494 Transcript_45816/m.103494 type:complete len:80 (+) Transcript_45816:333-572(+)